MTINKKPFAHTNEIEQALLNDQKHVWHHLTQHKTLEQSPPIMIVSGKGMRITDVNNKEYLDAVSGAVWTVNVGYGRERIAKAVYDQMLKMNYQELWKRKVFRYDKLWGLFQSNPT